MVGRVVPPHVITKKDKFLESKLLFLHKVRFGGLIMAEWSDDIRWERWVAHVELLASLPAPDSVLAVLRIRWESGTMPRAAAAELRMLVHELDNPLKDRLD